MNIHKTVLILQVFAFILEKLFTTDKHSVFHIYLDYKGPSISNTFVFEDLNHVIWHARKSILSNLYDWRQLVQYSGTYLKGSKYSLQKSIVRTFLESTLGKTKRFHYGPYTLIEYKTDINIDITILKHIAYLPISSYVKRHVFAAYCLWLLLLSWFNFKPSTHK